MKAILIDSYGGVEKLVLKDVPRPVPGDDEILVRVYAAGVNPADAKIREGKAFASLYRDPFPLILGWDASGVVEEVGKNVTTFKPGDAVFGMIGFPYEGGAYGEFIVARQDEIALKPPSLDHKEAAALPLAALTAWQALFDAADLKAGDKVLIHAGAGGVGHLGVQLAKWKGAYVISTCAKRDIDFLKEIGADEAIDYQAQRFEELVHEADVVIDSVGGETQDRSWQVLKKGGILVTIMEPPPEGKAEEYGVRGIRVFVERNTDELNEIAKLASEGLLTPNIYKVFSLSEAKKAHELIEKGETRGKIVLKVAG